MPIDWHRFHQDQISAPTVVDPRRRLRLCRSLFLGLLAVVFARAVQLEVTQGAAFREEALKPLVREKALPGVRGRILARDGTVLACDKKVLSLAVHYRYLQEPPDARWLHRTAVARLKRAERRDRQRVAAEEAGLLAQRAELAQRLMQLCGLSADEWNARAQRIQARVQRIAEGVYRRRQAGAEPPGDAPAESVLGQLKQTLLDALRGSLEAVASPVVVAEERDYHVMVEDVPLAAVAEIEGHPERYPGVKTIEQTRRDYPAGAMAAHVLGHLGAKEASDQEATDSFAEDFVGRMGIECRYESLLRGRRGVLVEMTDHSGRILDAHRRQEPGLGRDLVLTLDPQLQQTAEALLDSALERRDLRGQGAETAGGAIVVLDAHTGAVWAAASAPRFDPNLFVRGNRDELAALLADRAHRLFDGVSRMAIAPGSVFKTLTAVALLEAGHVDPQSPLVCQGYLRHPDQQRCEIYVRHGHGHGEVNLARALAVSCNVYFFHHAEQLSPAALIDWADRFGFGRPTGIDLPDEAAGNLPTPDTIRHAEGRSWRSIDTQMLAIGQSALTATPLQIARLMAAVANGGQLVTPHLVSRLALRDDGAGQPAVETTVAFRSAKVAEASSALRPPKERYFRGAKGDDVTPLPSEETSVSFVPPRPIPGLTPATLAAIRAGLEQTVAAPDGTAHGTVYLDKLAIAGKTGTAQAGGGRADHAWFAGYVPADKPKLVMVIALQHSGDGATAAGPIARRLVLRMQQLGML